MTNETIVADPSEFIDGRVELGLDELGLRIMQAEWGDAEHELFLVKQEKGEIAADRHPPNRTCTLVLKAEEDHPMPLAEVLTNLQMKVGAWQAEGGFVKRILDMDGGYDGDVGMLVLTAVLGGLYGWQMAHRRIAPEIKLVITTGPYCYALKEAESAEFEQAGGGEVQWELANIKGTVPGLMRIKFKNKMANDLRGAIYAAESRDHPQDATKGTTAALAYEAEELTLGQGGAEAVKAEASGGKVAKFESVGSAFQTLIKSKIKATGLNMTHVGPRQLIMRVYKTDAFHAATFRVRWRSLGSPYWSFTDEMTLPEDLPAGPYFIDLGQMRLDRPVLGNKGWEWSLQGKLVGSGTPSIEIDKFWPLPAEQFALASSPPVVFPPDAHVENPAYGSVVSAGAGTAWVNPEKVKVEDGEYATCEIGAGGQGQFIELTKLGFALPVGSTPANFVATVVRKSEGEGTITDFGVNFFIGATEPERGADLSVAEHWPTAVAPILYQGDNLMNSGARLTRAQVNSNNFGFRIAPFHGGGGTKKAFIDKILITVYYSELEDESAICFQTREVELRSDGMFRQGKTEEVWGKVVPDGFLPYAAPSLLEQRAMRGVFIPSTAALDEEEPELDTKKKGIVQIIYLPAYHFTSEAA